MRQSLVSLPKPGPVFCVSSAVVYQFFSATPADVGSGTTAMCSWFIFWLIWAAHWMRVAARFGLAGSAVVTVGASWACVFWHGRSPRVCCEACALDFGPELWFNARVSAWHPSPTLCSNSDGSPVGKPRGSACRWSRWSMSPTRTYGSYGVFRPSRSGLSFDVGGWSSWRRTSSPSACLQPPIGVWVKDNVTLKVMSVKR